MYLNIHFWIWIPVPCSGQRDCDYAVHFVCRHSLDRCSCSANLDGFLVCIRNQNHIFPLLTCCWEPFMSATAPASASNHSLTKPWLGGKKKKSLCILLFTTCWAWVMNESNIFSCMNTSYQMSWNLLSFFTIVNFLTVLWQILLWLCSWIFLFF